MIVSKCKKEGQGEKGAYFIQYFYTVYTWIGFNCIIGALIFEIFGSNCGLSFRKSLVVGQEEILLIRKKRKIVY